MAARTRRGTTEHGWTENVRARIRDGMLVNRLIAHGLGEIELSQTQVRAIEILLRKALPDLSAVEHSGDVKTTYVAEMPAAIASLDDWQKKQETQH